MPKVHRTTAGLYCVAVTLGERHVAGSPFSMQSFPAQTRSSHSVAFGPQLSVSTAGNLTEFYVLAKDTYGNEPYVQARECKIGGGAPTGSDH